MCIFAIKLAAKICSIVSKRGALSRNQSMLIDDLVTLFVKNFLHRFANIYELSTYLVILISAYHQQCKYPLPSGSVE